MPSIWCGDYGAANALLDQLVGLADEKGSLFLEGSWKFDGRLHFRPDRQSLGAVEIITSGLAVLRSTGSTVWLPLWLSCLAVAHAELGQFEEAWRGIDEAISTIETTKEKWFEAEANRVLSEIALFGPQRDEAKAQAYFERALTIHVRNKQSPGSCARR